MKKNCKILFVSGIAVLVAVLCLMGSLVFAGRIKTASAHTASAAQIVVPSVSGGEENSSVGVAQPYAQNELIVCNESKTFSGSGWLILDTGYANNPSLAFTLPYYDKSTQELSQMGYNRLSINFYFEFQEAGYEGKQLVRVADSSGSELRSKKCDVDDSYHTDSITFDIELGRVQYRKGILVQFDAEGNGRDDWYVKKYSMRIMYYKG